MNLKNKKLIIKVLISIFSVVVIWYIFIGIIFWVNPNLICMARINEDITWEIETYEPTETDPGATYINFFFNYEVWINTPLPFIHNFDGCHLKTKAEAILTNTSISDETLNYNALCYLASVPALYLPGITHKPGSVYFQLNYTEISELPEGLYTFWAGFGDLYGRGNILKSYKTYMNVSQDGISVYSDNPVDYTTWFWVIFIISICILIGSISVSYIGLIYLDKRKSKVVDK